MRGTQFDRLAATGDHITMGGAVNGRISQFNEGGRMYTRKESQATCGNRRITTDISRRLSLEVSGGS